MQIIIACEVLRPELEYLAKKQGKKISLIRANAKEVTERQGETDNADILLVFLEQGLHDTPDILRASLQNKLSELEEEYNPSSIVFAYGLCGKGFTGVHAKKATLIIPKVHDCIPLILGDGPDKRIRDEAYSKTFWSSVGWLKYDQLEHIVKREERYKQYIEDYGKDNADFLIETEVSWRQNYSSTCLIYWDELCSEQVLKDAQYLAQDTGLAFSKRRGDPWYLEELVAGGSNKEHFFHIPPYKTLDLNADALLEIVDI